jgi:hypothetical protein
MKMMRGHHLIHGIAVAETNSVWNFVATSVELTPEMKSALNAMTDVGVLSSSLPTSYGYFGKYDALDQSWAVLGRSYCSSERGGRNFVQSDLFLAPYFEFIDSGADASALLARLPPPQVVEKSGTKLEMWSVDGGTAEFSRLRLLEDFDREFLEKLLASVIREPTIFYGKDFDAEIVSALVLLLPPSLRAATTYTTIATDANTPVRLKVMRRDFPNTTSLVVEVDKRRFMREPDTAIAKPLIASWKEGLEKLQQHQSYLDQVLQPYSQRDEMVQILPRAQERWESRSRFAAGLSGPQKWENALEHLRLASSPADRAFVVEEIIGSLKLPKEHDSFKHFYKALVPTPQELPKIEVALGKRVAGKRDALLDAVTLIKHCEQLVETAFANASGDVRNMETALEVSRKMGGLMEDSRAIAFRDWSFIEPPSLESVGQTLSMIRSAGDLDLLRDNKKLLAQIQSVVGGRIAFRLAELSIMPPRGAALIAAAEELAATASQQPEAAVSAIAAAPKGWSSPEVALPFTAAILAADRKHAEQASDLFLDAYEAADETLLERVPKIKEAKAVVIRRRDHYKQKFLLADSRREFTTAGGDLRTRLEQFFQRKEDDRSKIADEILRIFKPADGRWHSSNLAWSLVGYLLNDRAMLETLVQLWAERPDATPLLRMIAMAGLADENYAALPIVVTSLRVLRKESEDNPHLRKMPEWVGKTTDDFQTICDVIELLGGHSAGRQASKLASSLPERQRATLAIAHLDRLRETLKDLDQNVGDLEFLADFLSTEPMPNLKAAVDNLLLALDGDLQSRLKELLKIAKRAAQQRQEAAWKLY